MTSRKIPVESILSDRELFDLIQNSSTKNIKTIEDVERVIDLFDDATDRSRSLTHRITSFIAGETRLSRGIGSVIDIGTIFIPHGDKVNRIRSIFNRKQNPRQMPVLEDKPWYQSKTMWSVILIVITGALQLFGVNLADTPEVADAIYRTIYTLAGAFGLYGLRDAVGKKKK